jgi:hypothetical protein
MFELLLLLSSYKALPRSNFLRIVLGNTFLQPVFPLALHMHPPPNITRSNIPS